MPSKRKAGEVGDGKHKKKRSKVQVDSGYDHEQPYKAYPVTGDAVQKAKDKGHYMEYAKLSRDFEWDVVVESHPQATQWDQLGRYKHVKLQDSKFSVGDIIYVNNNEKVPSPPSESASDAVLLKFEQENYWVAKIIEARAKTDKEVWLLVAWLYWPVELPNQTFKQYYGSGETVMSNSFDIIDAMTIACKADGLAFYDESDDFVVGQAAPRYWRQTYDTRRPGATTSLSSLRTFCKCQTPHLPDTKMYHCAQPTCNTWLHEECLRSEIGHAVWQSYQAGDLDKYQEDHAVVQQSLTDKVLSPVKAVGNLIAGTLEKKLEEGVEAVRLETQPGVETTTKKDSAVNGNGAHKSTPAKPSKPPPKAKAPWKDKLKINIVNEDGKPLFAQIHEKGGKQRKWEIRVNCLCCGKSFE